MKNTNASKIALYSQNGDRILSPAETIREMWEYTDENGTLIIPAWPRDDDDETPSYFRCAMTWNKEDAERLAKECETLVDTLKKYAVDHTVSARAQRLCRLVKMGAPKLLLDNEAFFLVQAMALRAFCRAHNEVNEAGEPIQTESNQQ